MSFIIIMVNPNTALVGSPSEAEIEAEMAKIRAAAAAGQEAAEAALDAAKALVARCDDNEDAARKALEAFIDRETEVEA